MRRRIPQRDTLDAGLGMRSGMELGRPMLRLVRSDGVGGMRWLRGRFRADLRFARSVVDDMDGSCGLSKRDRVTLANGFMPARLPI